MTREIHLLLWGMHTTECVWQESKGMEKKKEGDGFYRPLRNASQFPENREAKFLEGFTTSPKHQIITLEAFGGH